MIADDDMTIAMAPKALGAKSRVKIMLRPRRIACSATLPPPSHTPPRIAFGSKRFALEQYAGLSF